MSVTASEILTEFYLSTSDPRLKRLTSDEAIIWLNQASRDLARKLKLVEYMDTFTTVDEDAYQLPDGCIVVTRMDWTATPSAGDYKKLAEMSKTEFEMLTNGPYPVCEPYAYYVRASFFHLVGRPAVETVDGGRIHYYGVPDRVTGVSDTIKLADYMRDNIRNGMMILALEKLEEIERGSYQSWVASIPDDREDRSRDRRPNIRLSSSWQGRGAV